MKNTKKYMICFLLCISMLSALVFSRDVLAAENSHDCGILHMTVGDVGHIKTTELKKAVVVELDGEEDFYNYEINPNYRYIFIWESPAVTRAVCYNCGRSAMGVINRKTQYSADDRMCPIAPAALYNDYFATWHTYSHERCTACGYESEGYNLRITYSSFCCNDDNPIDGSMWEVKFEYTIGAGYNPHQCLSWWLYYDFL